MDNLQLTTFIYKGLGFIKTIGFLTSSRRQPKTSLLACLGLIALMSCAGNATADSVKQSEIEILVQFQGM